MEIVTELTQTQFIIYVPVALAIFGAILVFTFGFRAAQQPKFKLSGLDDRKVAGKKKKIKDKKPSANGHIATGVTKTEKSPSKDKKSPTKDSTDAKKEKKVDNNKDAKKTGNISTTDVSESKKKIKKAAIIEKPADFDDGNWEKVPTKADKKKKAEQSPVKKDKKPKKSDKSDTDVLIKEAVEKELKKDENIESVNTEVKQEPEAEKPEEKQEKKEEEINEEVVPVIEEKKEKKKEKKPKKETKEVKEVKPAPPVEEIQEELASEAVEPAKVEVAESAGAVFDELGDTWTEAKIIKKSKKKIRRDN